MEVEEKEDSIFDISLNEVDDEADSAEEDDAAHRLDSYLTIAELREAFSLEELMRMTKDGVLQSWLWERLLDAEAQELSQEKTAEMNDDEIRVLLCRLFDVDVTRLPRHEAARLEQSLEDCRILEARRASCGDDGVIVANQREFVEAMQNPQVRKFYLFDGAYTIPLQREQTTYDGRGNALIDIKAKDEELLNFDAKEIYFYNMTVVFHYAKSSQVKLEASRQNNNKILFLHVDRLSNVDSVVQQDIWAMLKGRSSFETAEQFQKRLYELGGVVLGTVLLEAEDYDIEKQAFFVHPAWKVDFAPMVRRYIDGGSLCFYMGADEAKSLYENERRLCVYAILSAEGRRAAIERIFLMDKDRKRLYVVYVDGNTSWCFSSASGSMGYGLELIAPLQ